MATNKPKLRRVSLLDGTIGYLKGGSSFRAGRLRQKLVLHLTPRRLRRPQEVPSSLAGKYVAWSPDGLRILGHGSTLAEARISAGDRAGLLMQNIPLPQHIRGMKDAEKPGGDASSAENSANAEAEAVKA